MQQLPGWKVTWRKDLTATVNKKSTLWPSQQCSPRILGLQETLLSCQGGGEGLSPPYLLKTSQVAKDTIYPVFPLQHLHWSKSGVSEERRAIICSPLPRGLFFRRDSEALLSAGRHISNSCFQLALLNSYTVVSGVYRKFEIPDILHMQDDDQEGKTPTETTTGQPQLAKEQRKLQQALYQCWN